MSKNSAQSRLHFFRNYLMTPIALVMIFLITAVIGIYGYRSMCGYKVTAMEESILVARNSYSFVKETQESNFLLAERVFTTRLNVFNTLIDSGETVEKSMSLVNEMGTASAQCYYRYADGTIVSPQAYRLPVLSGDEWNTLRTTGELHKGNSYYLLTVVNGKDEFISYWPEMLSDGIFSFALIAEKCHQNILIFNAKDGSCICYSEEFASSEDYSGKNLSDFILTPLSDSESEYIVYSYGLKDEGFFNSGIAVGYVEADGTVFLSVMKNSYILSRIALWLTPFLMLLIAFYFLMLKTCFTYRKMWKEGVLRSDSAKKIGKLYVDPKLLKSAASLVIVVFVIMLIVVCLIHVLNLKTDLNYEQSEKLNLIAELHERYCITDNEMTSLFEDNAYRMADFVADRIDDSMSRDSLIELAELTDIERIDVYDENGVIVAGSSGYEGYTLSGIETDPECSLWPVINGETQHMMVFADSNHGMYYAATKRKDSVGMIRLTMSNSALSHVYDYLDIESLLVNSDSGVSDIICIDRSNTGIYYLYDSETRTVSTHINDFKEDVFINGHVSSIKLTGEKYTTYTLVTDDLILVCLDEPVSYLDTLTVSAVVFGLGCLLLIILMLLGTAVYEEETLEDAPETAESENNSLSGFQRKILIQVVNKTFVITCLYYIVDQVAGFHPVISFLFGKHWSYGTSFYSFICAISDMALSVIICMVCHFFYEQLSKLFNSRSKTIVRLLYSVVCVITVAVGLVLSLRQLGIDMTTILGGLGLTGLALSLGAQSTLADLIAGISMILDRHVQIGDFVEVGGFAGEIIDINIRTTKIKCGNVIKSVQNSSMVNISRTISSEGAIPVGVNFVIPYSVPKDTVVSALIKNEKRFAEAAPGLFKSGIKYLNIVSFEVYGVNYVITLSAEPSMRNVAAHTMLSVVKQIMEENGIPFAESVITAKK